MRLRAAVLSPFSISAGIALLPRQVYISESYLALRPSSSGQDGALSRRKQGFDSPWAYQ